MHTILHFVTYIRPEHLTQSFNKIIHTTTTYLETDFCYDHFQATTYLLTTFHYTILRYVAVGIGTYKLHKTENMQWFW